ncbi:putative ankyrin repeat domain-containing protein 31 [Athene cunicularia]|uniref:putative ankyrin repeat domain-containing protein 31 n=1 Tax=Athene cunicularia TaxID=194338 RepID=UPI000EF74146|nr:putative ankyrin repeat domain-containing protein 31 [Athene cunicularia]
MAANALWGWLQQWKWSNRQRRGKLIWAVEFWQDIAARVQNMVVKVCHIDDQGRPPAAPGGGEGRGETGSGGAVEEPGGGENSGSRESVVEGSETESDVEEEEFRWRRWLPFLSNVALTTDIRITEGACSPEISFIQKFYDHTYSEKEERINPTPQEAYVSDQSQSLMQGWIKCLSHTEDISKPGFSLNAAVEGQQNNSVDTELNGFQKDLEEKPVSDQQREKEVIPDYWDAIPSEKQTSEGSSHSVESAACAYTAQTTSRKVMQLRETSRKHRDLVSSHCQILEETQQRMSHSGRTTGSKAKDFDKIQKSTSKDKQDLEINICQKINLNEVRKAQQRRRSMRIKTRQRQEAFGRNSVKTACHVSLSAINRRNVYGETLLHKAVTHQDVHLVPNIIKAGGNVNVQDYAGWTPLHKASVKGFYGIANELLKAGADVNARGNEQITPLQDAVEEGHYKVAELLLWYGADPLLKDEMGRCAFKEASDSSMRKLLKSYLAKSRRNSLSADEGVFGGGGGTEGTEKNGEEGDAKSSVLSQFTETEYIQTEGVRLDSQELSQKAASCSSSNKIKLSSNQSQFSQATEQQTSKKSEFFLSTRKEALIGTYNTRSGRKKKKKNTKGETQLHIAARRGDLSLVKTLISSGICVNEQDYAGWTAIHEASCGGFTEVILELLKAGANVNSRSLDGILPIHDAVSGNYLEAVRILLQHGANPCERNGSGKSALDEACDDEMRELLNFYSAMDSVLPVETTEVTKRKRPFRSRSKRHCCNYCKNDAALEPQDGKYSVETVAAIQAAEEEQKELLLLELRTSKDADLYIQRLFQIQDTLNEMLAKQKMERDTLAKKCRASVQSFKKGSLRKQLVNLASRQKGLLMVVQTQEELVQKIQNYRKAMQVFSASCSEKQISNLIISYGNDKRQSLTADEIMYPDVVTFNVGLGANMPNGNRVEAHLSSEDRFSAQECSQYPHICLDETGANKAGIRSKEASDHPLASENRVGEYPFDMSKLTKTVKVVMLPSEPAVPTAKTKYLEQKDIDCVTIAKQGNGSLNPSSVTNTLKLVEPRSTVVNNNVGQPGSNCQQVLRDEDLHSYVNKKETFQQQQQVISSTSTKNFPDTLQRMICTSTENSFNNNLVLTNLTSNTDYPINFSVKSSQSYSNQEREQKQVMHRRTNSKKLQLIDLLELGRIKPGENVLEFKLQEFSYKATLLSNGKIRTSKRTVLQNPVQWVKDLLGGDISVTRKYVWNKVTYLGTQLSKFLSEEVSVSSDLELPSQEREPLGRNFTMRDPSNHNHHHQSPGTVSIAQPLGSFGLNNMPKTSSLLQTEVVKTLLCAEREAAFTKEFKTGSSVQFNSVESLSRFLQFHEVVMVCKEEFLPCPVMEKHWNFYKACEDFGF